MSKYYLAYAPESYHWWAYRLGRTHLHIFHSLIFRWKSGVNKSWFLDRLAEDTNWIIPPKEITEEELTQFFLKQKLLS